MLKRKRTFTILVIVSILVLSLGSAALASNGTEAQVKRRRSMNPGNSMSRNTCRKTNENKSGPRNARANAAKTANRNKDGCSYTSRKIGKNCRAAETREMAKVNGKTRPCNTEPVQQKLSRDRLLVAAFFLPVHPLTTA